MRALLRYSAVTLLAAVAACSARNSAVDDTESKAPEAASPESVARAFMEAGNAGDLETFKSLLTPKAREGFAAEDGMSLDNAKFEDYTVMPATVTGTEAKVPIEAVQDGEEQNLHVQMRRESNEWLIYALGISTADGMNMTINLEKLGTMMESVVEGMGQALQEGMQTAFEDAMTGGSEEQIAKESAQFEALKGVPESVYSASWTNERDFRGSSVGEALSELATSMRLTIVQSDGADYLAEEVTVEVQDLSNLAAVERICEQVGMYPVYPEPGYGMDGMVGAMGQALAGGMEEMLFSKESALSITDQSGKTPDFDEEATEDEPVPPNAITFEPGPRPYSVTFAGPFIIEAMEIEENAPYATGEVSVTVRTYGIDPGLLPLLTESSEAVTFAKIVDSKDRSLHAEEGVSYLGGGMVEGSAYSNSYGIDLKNLLRDVEEIASVQGVSRIDVPMVVEDVMWDSLQAGQTKRVKDLMITLKESGKNTRFEITGPEDIVKKLEVRFRPLDADGKPMGMMMQGADSWMPDTAQAYFNTHEPAASAEMKLVMISKTFEYPWELKNLPLKHYADQPAKLEQLSYKGSAPVAVTFGKFVEHGGTAPTVMVKAANKSNKQVQTIQTEFVYLDAAGNELESFPNTLQGAFTVDGWQPLAAPGETAEVETSAFFMPEETKDIRVRVKKVEFMDATEWDAEN